VLAAPPLPPRHQQLPPLPPPRRRLPPPALHHHMRGWRIRRGGLAAPSSPSPAPVALSPGAAACGWCPGHLRAGSSPLAPLLSTAVAKIQGRGSGGRRGIQRGGHLSPRRRGTAGWLRLLHAWMPDPVRGGSVRHDGRRLQVLRLRSCFYHQLRIFILKQDELALYLWDISCILINFT
jgi:hypothetical protein